MKPKLERQSPELKATLVFQRQTGDCPRFPGNKTQAKISLEERKKESMFELLDAIPDNYEKVVVTLDDVAMGDRNGVRHVQAWEFVE